MRINYRGSSRKLAGNSIAAMVAAVEVYNKICQASGVSLVLLWDCLET
jgi:hypothetical protein